MAGTPIVGVDDVYFAKIETTFDSVGSIVAGDFLPLAELKFEPKLDYEMSKEHVGSASLQDEIEAKRGGTWSLVGYVKPKAAGVAPDMGPVLQAAFGTETIVGGTSVAYTLKESGTPDSLSFVRHSGDGFYEGCSGAWVEQVDTEIVGGGICKITANGGFARYIHMYSGITVDSIQTAPDTTIKLTTGHAARVSVGARIKFDTEDNGGAGYLVTAVDTTTDIITISPTLAGGLADLDAVAPVSPTPVPAGAIQGGIACGLSVDATAIGMISGKLSFSTGIHGLDKEATANRATRLARGTRSITGTIEVYYLDENSPYLAGAWSGTTRNIEQRAGPDTAAARLKIQTPKARMAVAPMAVPEADEATATITYVARKSTTNGDELKFLLD